MRWINLDKSRAMSNYSFQRDIRLKESLKDAKETFPGNDFRFVGEKQSIYMLL